MLTGLSVFTADRQQVVPAAEETSPQRNVPQLRRRGLVDDVPSSGRGQAAGQSADLHQETGGRPFARSARPLERAERLILCVLLVRFSPSNSPTAS